MTFLAMIPLLYFKFLIGTQYGQILLKVGVRFLKSFIMKNIENKP